MVGQAFFANPPTLSSGFISEFHSSVLTSDALTALKIPEQELLFALQEGCAWDIHRIPVFSSEPLEDVAIRDPAAPTGPFEIPLIAVPSALAVTGYALRFVFSEN